MHHLRNSGYAKLPMQSIRKLHSSWKRCRRRVLYNPQIAPGQAQLSWYGKKDGSLRFCIDYLHLNSVTKVSTAKDWWPSRPVEQINVISQHLTLHQVIGKSQFTQTHKRKQPSLPPVACLSFESCNLGYAMPRQRFKERWNGSWQGSTLKTNLTSSMPTLTMCLYSHRPQEGWLKAQVA